MKRQRNTVAWALTLAAAILPGPGCGRQPTAKVQAEAEAAGGASKTARAGASVKTYKVVGVVRHVSPENGRVTIRHEEIPGFMAAMTMPFTVKDRQDLEDVHPGDEVEGSLRVETAGGEVSRYELTSLSVSRYAPPPALTLNLSGGKPELATAPKVLRPGDPVPDFTMTDQDGKTFKLSDLRGKVVALTFIFTRCPLPDFCPRMDRKFAALADRVAAVPARGERVRLVSVSIDPDHDTPEVLKEHARRQGAKPPLWTFAVAPHRELDKVSGPLGLVFGPARDGIIHNLTVAVIDPEGRLTRLETGPAAGAWDPLDLLKTIYSRIPRS